MPLSKKATLTLAGAAGVLALGLAVPAVALAEGATPSPSTSASGTPDPSASGAPGQPEGGKADRERRGAERRAALAEGLAKELGIDQDKVEAALEKVEANLATAARTERQARLKERLDQAVEDGTLTQEQADAILKAAEAGVLPGGAGRGGHGGAPR
jgi:hypothetical protein